MSNLLRVGLSEQRGGQAMSKRHIVACVVAAVLALASALPALAQEGDPEWLPVDVPGTNIVFMNVRVPEPGLDLYQTRAMIWKRLVEAFAAVEAAGETIDGDLVTVEAEEGADPRILVGGHLIIAVDPFHAAINGSTQEDLAAVWAANLRRALDRWAELHRL